MIRFILSAGSAAVANGLSAVLSLTIIPPTVGVPGIEASVVASIEAGVASVED
jgi:hypothetical protein